MPRDSACQGIHLGKGAPNNGPTDTLFFTAGPFDEQHGLFGRLVVSPPPEGEPKGRESEGAAGIVTSVARGSKRQRAIC